MAAASKQREREVRRLRSRAQRFAALTMALSILALVIVLTISAGPSQAGTSGVSTVEIGSAAVPTNAQFTVGLTVTPAQGVTVGAADTIISYDNSLLSVVSCATFGNVICNPDHSPNSVLFVAAELDGLSGLIGTVTLMSQSVDTVTMLDVSLTTCADVEGNDLTCVGGDGTVTIFPGSPTPIPTTSPSPSPTPTPGAFLWGDVDCNLVVNAVDALAIQRWKVLLPVAQEPGCLEIGVPALPTLWGDVDCGGVVNAVDSLAIQRWKVALPVAQTPPCPVIGSAYP